jgi:hypothetical protein
MELEVVVRLTFLDVKISRSSDKISTNLYKKPINSNLILQYDSAHPSSVKNGIANTLLHRAEAIYYDTTKYNTEINLVEVLMYREKKIKLIGLNVSTACTVSKLSL